MKGARKDTPEGAAKVEHIDLNYNAHEGAFETTLKGVLEAALELHLWLIYPMVKPILD